MMWSMRRLVGMIVTVLAACGAPGDDAIDDRLTVEGTSDVPLDRVDLFYIVFPRWPVPATGPITPGRRARGDLLVESAQVATGQIERADLAGETAFAVGIWVPFESPGMIAVGYRRDAGGVLQPVVAGLVGGGVEPRVHLTAGFLARVEVWNDGACLRVDDPVPRYFVLADDVDCDGLATADDCDDASHCDLDAATPEARAGCTTDRCRQCLDETAGACALGTRGVCVDDADRETVPTFACTSDPTCGTPVCLPESSCGRGCGDDADTEACLRWLWGNGPAPSDVIDCALPAQHPDGDPLLLAACDGGSIVEVALPYTDCTDAQVVIAGTVNEVAMAAILPPCTLQYGLTHIPGTGGLFPQGALVTFRSGGALISARLHLEPQGDTCGALGTCTAPAGSTCSR